MLEIFENFGHQGVGSLLTMFCLAISAWVLRRKFGNQLLVPIQFFTVLILQASPRVGERKL